MNSCRLHTKKASILALVVTMLLLFSGITGAVIGASEVYSETMVEATTVGSTEE